MWLRDLFCIILSDSCSYDVIIVSAIVSHVVCRPRYGSNFEDEIFVSGIKCNDKRNWV